MELGNKINELRKKYGFSQEELADKVNVTRQTISKWELGETAPDILQAKELARIFNVDLNELVGGETREVLVNKVSNVERLAGLIIKMLKIMGIGLLLLIIMAIISGILFSSNKSKVFTKEATTCHLEDEVYSYEITFDSNNKIISVGGDSYLINVLDLEKYEYSDQLRDVVSNYFTSNNGGCK